MKVGIKEYLKLALKYNKKNWLIILVGVILGIISELALLGGAFLTRFIIDDIIIAGNAHLFKQAFLLLIGLLIILFLASTLANYIIIKVFTMNSIMATLELFKNLLFAPFNFFSKTPPGETTYRTLSDTANVTSSWLVFITIIPLNIVLIATGIIMLYWHRTIALFVFLMLILNAIIIALFREPILNYSLRLKNQNQKITGEATEVFSKIELIRSLCTEEKEATHFHQELYKLAKISIKAFMINKFSEIVTLCVNNLWILGTIWYGGIQVIEGKISIGKLFAFLMFSNFLQTPVSTLIGFILSFQNVKASFHRILEYFGIKPYPVESKQAKEFIPSEGRIKIENCSFGYDTSLVLKNINLEIEPKSIVALVGPSGSGKTTLCRLLVRFYDPQQGRILIDDQDIKNLSLSSLRRNVLLFLQNNYVIKGSILENITYGKEEQDEKEALIAAKKAKIDNLINASPFGLKTMISSNIIDISAGEAQRIALARIFYLSPHIVILDEPTSFIDIEAEQKIKEALLELKKISTIILICHRLSSVMIADKIVVIKNGQIMEEGTPKELLSEDKTSIFKNLLHNEKFLK